MKVREYIEKYNDLFTSNDEDTAVNAAMSFLTDLHNEAKELLEKRNVSTYLGMVSVFKEQNQKWNIVAKQFPFLNKDGFRITVLKIVPEIEKHWV